jgi:hypothetical protein
MRALWDNGKFTAAELVKQFGISVPTFFRRMRRTSLKKVDHSSAPKTGQTIY